MHEAAGEFIQVDSKIAVTLRLLLTRPGEPTSEFLRGRRIRYVSPLRLYLTASFVYFLLGAVLPNADFNVDTSATVGGEPPAAAVVIGRVVAAVPKAIFAMVPVFAGLVWLAYRSAARHYPAFLYFSLHVHAAFFIFLTPVVPLQTFATDLWITAVQFAVFVGMIGYLSTALRRVFGGTRAQALRRALTIVMLHTLVFVGVLTALFFVLR